MNDAVSSIMARSWPYGSRIEVKIKFCLQKTPLGIKKYILQYHTALRITSISTRHKHLVSFNYSIEINPGPREPKFPRGECHKQVSIDPTITFDNCD